MTRLRTLHRRGKARERRAHWYAIVAPKKYPKAKRHASLFQVVDSQVSYVDDDWIRDIATLRLKTNYRDRYGRFVVLVKIPGESLTEPPRDMNNFAIALLADYLLRKPIREWVQV